jgi:hypothetical protein
MHIIVITTLLLQVSKLQYSTVFLTPDVLILLLFNWTLYKIFMPQNQPEFS